jgi:ketosteroid isomerase-like protein
MKKSLYAAVVSVLVVTSLCGQEQTPRPADPADEALRAVRDGMMKAFNERDVDGLLQYLHPNVVVTWQNSEVSRSPEQVREYFHRMLESPNRRVDTLTAEVQVDELAILYGADKTTAVAYGTLGDRYRTRNGVELNLNSRWSATLVKNGDRWLIVNAHASGNLFRNDFLSFVLKTAAYWIGGIVGVAGIAVGILVTLGMQRFIAIRKEARQKVACAQP